MNSLSMEHFQDSEAHHVTDVRLKETNLETMFLWIRGKWNPNLKLLFLNLCPVLFHLQWSVTLPHLLSPLLFSSSPWHPLCQSFLRCVAFLFCQNILWVWHACRNQRMHATCCTSLRRRTGFFLFFFPRRALEAFEDHQSCQLQTQINYNLEDDPIRLTSTVCFCSSIYVCAHLLSSTV